MSAGYTPSPRRRNAYAATTLLLAAGGPSALGFVPGAGPWGWLLFVAGVVAIIIAVAMEVTRLHRENRRLATRDGSQARERDERHSRVRDALVPIAELTAQLPALTVGDRRIRLQGIAQAATTALYMLISSHAHGVRANVFDLESNPDRMTWLAHTGRGQAPGPFLTGTPRGDAAFDFITKLSAVRYANLAEAAPKGYGGTRGDYQTFISAPIWTDEMIFGMLTVDASNPGSLTLGDMAIVELVAEMLAAAFAVATTTPLDPPTSVTSSF